MEKIFEGYDSNIFILNAKVIRVELPDEITKNTDFFLYYFINKQFNPNTLCKISRTQVSDFYKQYMMPIYSIRKIESYKNKPLQKRITLGLVLKKEYYPPSQNASRRGKTPKPYDIFRQEEKPKQVPLQLFITFETTGATEMNHTLEHIHTTFLDYAEQYREAFNQELYAMAPSVSFSQSKPSSVQKDPWAISTPSSSESLTEEEYNALFKYSREQPGNASTSGSGGAKPGGAKPVKLAKPATPAKPEGAKKKKVRLDTLTKQELIDRCRAKKIPYSGRTKAELVAALRR